jgi:hypothetical protein
MSDYGYDEDDYGDDWLYVEDEYMQADDLAEHAVASPPPTACDEDRLDEWDRFDYFNDIEYDFEGYDDANFVPHSTESVARKRKRRAPDTCSQKRQRTANGHRKPETDVAWLSNAPIVWRPQADRDPKSRPLPDDAEPYALLKDWRQRLDNVPDWVSKPSRTTRELRAPSQERSPSGILEAVPDGEWEDEEGEEGEEDEEDEEDQGGEQEAPAIDPAAIMAALQSRLASAGGPLSGMDPQQLLQFALRMANGEGEGDEIAGEMADEILNQGDEAEEGDDEAEAQLMSWVSRQREANADETPTSTRKTPSKAAQPHLDLADEAMGDVQPETSTVAAPDHGVAVEIQHEPHTLEVKQTSRKRKADAAIDPPAAPSKKRVTKSYAAPTAASQAKSGTAKATRSGRIRR